LASWASSPGDSRAEANRAQRSDTVAIPEVAQKRRADQSTGEAHKNRREDACPVLAGHHHPGQQANDGAEARPEIHVVGPEAKDFPKLCLIHKQHSWGCQMGSDLELYLYRPIRAAAPGDGTSRFVRSFLAAAEPKWLAGYR